VKKGEGKLRFQQLRRRHHISPTFSARRCLFAQLQAGGFTVYEKVEDLLLQESSVFDPEYNLFAAAGRSLSGKTKDLRISDWFAIKKVGPCLQIVRFGPGSRKGQDPSGSGSRILVRALLFIYVPRRKEPVSRHLVSCPECGFQCPHAKIIQHLKRCQKALQVQGHKN